MKRLNKILSRIKKYIGTVEKNKTAIRITVNHKKISSNGINLLYYLLNLYEEYFFIMIASLPYCIMPDALEHMVEIKQEQRCFSKDKICKDCDFIDKCEGCKRFISIDKNKCHPLKDIPKEIILETTTQCNLNCQVCHQDKKAQIWNLNFSKTKEIIDEARLLGIKAIRFTGGEPLLNRDIRKMLLYAKKNNFYVLLNTNATDIPDAILQILKETVDNILVSLQGYNETTDHQLTRSHTDFKNKLKNILKLKAYVPVLRVGTIISQTLIHHFDRYEVLLRRLGITYWNLFRPLSKKADDEFNISKNDILKVMRLISEVKKHGLHAKITNPVPFCIAKDIHLSLATLLGANLDDGHSRIVFDARGYFKPSYFMDVKLGKTIREAWENPFLKKIRSLGYLPIKCKNCDYLKWCRGGSRIIPGIKQNNYFVEDPLFNEDFL